MLSRSVCSQLSEQQRYVATMHTEEKRPTLRSLIIDANQY
jgi:hypothetical protein